MCLVTWEIMNGGGFYAQKSLDILENLVLITLILCLDFSGWRVSGHFILSLFLSHTHRHIGKRNGGCGGNLVLFSEYLIQPSSTFEIMGPFFRQKESLKVPFFTKNRFLLDPFSKKWGPLKICEDYF